MPEPIRLRSLLFVPGTRPDMVAKMPRFGPDAVVVDLEDAVAADDKVAARTSAMEAVDALTGQADRPRLVFIRVNQSGTPWHDADLTAALASTADGVVLPKLQSVGERDAVLSRMGGAQILLAGIESALGVADARALLADGVSAAYFGAEDFAADVGGRRTPGNLEVLYARSQVALAGRLAGVPVLDQIVADIHDAERFRADAQQGADLGYVGKICIHPAQVALAHEAFTPSEEALAHARKVIAASASGVGLLDGEMVDEVHVTMARTVLARGDHA